jgi:hypothetical protein
MSTRQSGKVAVVIAAMQPANEIIVRPAGRRPDQHFEAMIAQLRPGNVDPFDGKVDLHLVDALTNPMAERLGQALLATNRTVTEMTIQLDSMTPEGSEYSSLLRFLESSALGEMTIILVGNPGSATPAADEKMNRTVTALLSSMHRNAETAFELRLNSMAFLPTVLSLALEFVRSVWICHCTCINNKRETTATRPLVPVASALAPCGVHVCWEGDTLPIEVYEMIAALANIMARPLHILLCAKVLELSVQLAQSILDLAKRKELDLAKRQELDLAKRQESPIKLYLCLDTIAWQAGSIEILTQHSSAIGLFAISFCQTETDQGIVQRAQIDLLECLQRSTVKEIYLRTLLPTNLRTDFLDAIGQEKLDRIVHRNRIVPHLLSGQYQPTDRYFCYLLPYALRVGAQHDQIYFLVAKWIAANAHRTRRQSSSPLSSSSEHAHGSSQGDDDNDFGTDARATKRRRL